jgi:hypothetical protein
MLSNNLPSAVAAQQLLEMTAGGAGAAAAAGQERAGRPS